MSIKIFVLNLHFFATQHFFATLKTVCMKMLANRPLIRLEKMQSNSVITIMVISKDIVALTDNFCPFSYPNDSFSTSMFTVITKSRPSRTYIGILVYLKCLLKPSLTKICHFIFLQIFASLKWADCSYWPQTSLKVWRHSDFKTIVLKLNVEMSLQHVKESYILKIM